MLKYFGSMCYEIFPVLFQAGEDGYRSELLTLKFMYKYGEHTLKISHFFEGMYRW